MLNLVVTILNTIGAIWFLVDISRGPRNLWNVFFFFLNAFFATFGWYQLLNA